MNETQALLKAIILGEKVQPIIGNFLKQIIEVAYKNNVPWKDLVMLSIMTMDDFITGCNIEDLK